MWTEDEYRAVRAAAILTTLAVVLWCIMRAALAHSDPLPQQLTLYSPPYYDAFGATPVPITTANPDTGSSAAFPRAWLWPGGRFDLTGVFYAFWSPPSPPFGVWNPRSKRTVSVNYARVLAATPQVGDTLKYVGFQNARMSLFHGVEDDSTVVLKRGFAIITAAADSVIEFRAWMIVRASTWANDDSLATFGRLVPETYRRATFAAGQP